MDKRQDIQIYELAYNKVKYGFWDNSLYTPLQCGADRSRENVCELKDNTGINISAHNFYYSETTGTFWMWKNAPKTDYIGQCQYRRRLKFDEDFDFNKIFNRQRIIVAKPMFIGRPLRRQMSVCHPQIDIKAFEDIVYETQPAYKKVFDQVFNNGCALFFSSSYIMKYEDFCRYCNFMFSIIRKYEERFHFDDESTLRKYVKDKLKNPSSGIMSKPLEYHMLIGGFLQERLFTIWILANFRQDEIYYKDFEFMEDSVEVKKYIKQ